MRPPGLPDTCVVVALDVRPRLLCGALARVLRAEGLTVVVVEEGAGRAAIDEGYDVVVTSEPAPAVDGSLVLRVLDAAVPDGAGGAPDSPALEGTFDIDRLTAALARIDRLRVERAAHRPVV